MAKAIQTQHAQQHICMCKLLQMFACVICTAVFTSPTQTLCMHNYNVININQSIIHARHYPLCRGLPTKRICKFMKGLCIYKRVHGLGIIKLLRDVHMH